MERIKVSVPHRLDIGGTWDLPALMLYGNSYRPMTVTLALDLRTTVEICRYNGFPCSIRVNLLQPNEPTYEWVGTPAEYDYAGQLGLIQGVLSYYGLEGVCVSIKSDVPSQVGLGGSGVLTVALVLACQLWTGAMLDRAPVIRLVHEIENGIFSMTGYQDQMAAFTGGVQLWRWQYPGEYSKNTELTTDYEDIESRLVIALVGRHNSTDINDKQVASFMSSRTREHWLEINEVTHCAAKAIMENDWAWLADAIRTEHSIRNMLVPERIAGLEEYINVDANGAVATAGAGQAVVWFFGVTPEDAERVRSQWQRMDCVLLDSKISRKGFCIEECTSLTKVLAY